MCRWKHRPADPGLQEEIHHPRVWYILTENKWNLQQSRKSNWWEGVCCICCLFLRHGNVNIESVYFAIEGPSAEKANCKNPDCVPLLLTSSLLPSLYFWHLFLTLKLCDLTVSLAHPRLQTTSPSSPNSAQNSGACLCAQWTARGGSYRLILDKII